MKLLIGFVSEPVLTADEDSEVEDEEQNNTGGTRQCQLAAVRVSHAHWLASVDIIQRGDHHGHGILEVAGPKFPTSVDDTTDHH